MKKLIVLSFIFIFSLTGDAFTSQYTSEQYEIDAFEKFIQHYHNNKCNITILVDGMLQVECSESGSAGSLR